MLYRTLFAFLPLTVSAAIYSGALPVQNLIWGSSYSKEVAASPAEVRAALEAIPLGIDQDPGGIGNFDALPPVRRTDNADGITWTLTSGDKVAMEMKVVLVPRDGGRATRVEGQVSRGDAPADSLPPGLRLTSSVNMVFSNLLDSALNPFAPPGERLSPEALRAKQAQAAGMMSALQLATNPAAVAGQFQRVREQMEKEAPPAEPSGSPGGMPAYSSAGYPQRDPSNPDVSFQPGKPMVDARR